MRKFNARLFAVVILCTAPFVSSGGFALDIDTTPSPEAEKAAIRAQTERFSAAYMQGDVGRIMDFFSDDARIVPVKGRILAGRERIESFWAGVTGGPTSLLSLKMDPEQLVVAGDMATGIGYFSGEASGGAQKSAFGGTFMMVWKKSDGEWRMQHSMWAPLATPSAER